MAGDLFHIMPSRLEEMNAAMRGYDSTQTFLVGVADNNTFFPLGVQDDFGLSFYGTLLNSYLGVPIDKVFPMLLSIVILIGFGIATWGILRRFKSGNAVVMMTILNTALAVFAFKRGDVYATNYITSSILFALLINQWKQAKEIIIPFSFASLLLGLIELIRSKSGLGGLLSIMLLLFLLPSRVSFFKKSLIAICCFMMFSFHGIIKNKLAEDRNHWFSVNQQKVISNNIGHPVWHSVYIGLGLVSNTHGITYQDEVAANKVKEIGGENIVFCSKEYEEILKTEVFRLLKTDSVFILKSLGLKALICLVVFAILGFPLWYYKEIKLLLLSAPFLLLSFLPAILVYPRINYMLGAILFLTVLSGYVLVMKTIHRD